MYCVRSVKPKATTMKPDKAIHERVQQAIAAHKIKPMSLQALILVYGLPQATAQRILREVAAMHGTRRE